MQVIEWLVYPILLTITMLSISLVALFSFLKIMFDVDLRDLWKK